MVTSTLKEQLSRQSLALVSLLVALTALSYTTWRNEQTETNRNIRRAGFEMMVHVAELQRIAYLAHFDQDKVGGNPRKGWVEVLVIKDLASFMPATEQVRSEKLYAAWNDNWNGLGENDLAIAAIDVAINDLRKDIVRTLDALD
ncbi:MAG: hypothetical protein ACR2QB_00745 [Gammaproteobacteria bacterium]